MKVEDTSSGKGMQPGGRGIATGASSTSGSPSLRRSTRGLSTAEILTPAPSSRRKSERLEKHFPGDARVEVQPAKVEKQEMTTHLRRSERGKQNVSSSPDVKQSVQGPNVSKRNQKREKRERSVNEVTMEAPNVSTSKKGDLESVQVKKRRVDHARKFRAFFMEQQKKTDTADPGEELELNESDQLARVDGTSSDESQQVVEMGLMSRETNEMKLTDEIQPLEISSDDSRNSGGKAVETQGQEGTSVLSQKESWEAIVDDGLHTSRSSDASIHNVRTEVEDIIMAGVAERCNESIPEKEQDNNGPTDSDQITCATCKLGFGGKFLCCNGKGCHLSYHPSCLDPPMKEVPPGVWHCTLCVRKKILSGPRSVSDGIESIWDAREMDLHGKEGMQRQRHLLVKYKGLSHAHNQWVPESQLLLEAPILFAEFNKQSEVRRWKPDWALPHRLLKRRFLSRAKQCDECTTNQAYDSSAPQYEWLVKWCGLDYDHCTWELEDAPVFNSSEAQSLVRDYEDRCERAKRISLISNTHKTKKGPVAKLLKLPDGCSPDLDINYLLHVNKMRDYWHKKRNAVIFDDEDRIVKVIIFILSLQSESCLPFLIISDSPSLYLWESEFLRLAPSMNAILYDGDSEVRQKIRTLEFYDNEGRVFFQVLLASPQAMVEDLEVFKGVRWTAAIVDDFPCFGVLASYEHFVEVATDLRLVFRSCQMKDSAVEYLNILSFLESGKDSNNAGELRGGEGDNIANLKERLACYIAYECRMDSSRFVEYWVPVQISNVQLEQYCQTLLSKSFLLCSKNDCVDALREILISLRKTCNHPFLVDPALQGLMIEGHQVVEYLDVGIKSSGKLQLLDKMLLEIKRQGLRVLILYESIGGSGRDSIGDFLDDFLRQRFGSDSYERVDGGGFIPSRKQAALNKFNKESGRFVFLLQTCACLPSIKLSSVDAVIVFDSDWNPMTDSRALQRIKIDSQFEQIKVFRLYTTSTVEENILILSKYDMISEGRSNAMNQNTSRKLLLWGASNLFTELENFHGTISADTTASTLSEHSHLDELVEGLMTLLLRGGDHKVKRSSVILKLHKDGGNHGKNLLLPGELEIPLTDEELPHSFWSQLLKGKNPRWIYLSCSTQRNRRRIQYFDDSKTELNIGTDETVKRRKKNVDSCTTSVSPKSVPEIDEEAAEQGEGCHLNSNTPREHEVLKSDSRRNVRDAQKSLLLLLKPEILRLCELLKLSESVKGRAETFLQYVMDNHRVTKEPVTILQAFQLALCWAAASFLGYKIDRKESLALAKQHLSFCCTEEEVNHVHEMLDSFKDMFSYHIASQRIAESSLNPVAETESSSQARSSQLEASNLQGLIGEEVSVSGACLQQKWTPDLNLAGAAFIKLKKRIEKKCRKRMSDLRKKQKEELEVFYRNCDEEKAQLEREYKMEVAVVRSIHGPSGADKLKNLEDEYKKRFIGHKYQVELRLKSLMNAQLDAKNEEEEFKARCLGEMNSWTEVELKDKIFGRESTKRLDESLSIKEPQVSEHFRTPDNPEENNIMAKSGMGTQGIANVLNGVISNDVSMKSSQSADKETGRVTILPEMVETACEEAIVGVEDVTEVNKSDRCDGSIIDEDIVPLIVEKDGTNFLQQNIAESSFSPESLSSEAQDVSRATILAGMAETARTEVAAARDIAEVQQHSSCEGLTSGDILSSPVQNFAKATMPTGETASEEAVIGKQAISELNLADGGEGSCSKNAVPIALSAENSPTIQAVSNPSDCSPLLFDEVPQCECSHPTSSPRLSSDNTIAGDDNALEQIKDQQSLPAVSSDEHYIEAQTDEPVPLPSESPCASARIPPGVQVPVLDGVASSSNQRVNGGAERRRVNTGNDIPSCETNLEAQMEEVDVQTQVSSPSSNLLHSNDTSDLVWANSNLDPSYQQSPPQGQANMPSDQVHVQLATQVSYTQSSDILGYQLPTPSDARTQPSYSAQGATTSCAAVLRTFMPSNPEPLQYELERMRTVIDHEIKTHDDEKLQLKLAFEKEITELRRKYEAKVQDAEAAFMIKKYELDSYTQKVYMNKLLADAFRSKCMDGKPSGSPVSNQGSNSTRQQQPSRLSSQEARERCPSVTSTTSVSLPSASMHATGSSSGHIARPSLVSHLSTSPMIVPPSRPSTAVIASFPSSAPLPSMPTRPSSVTVPSLVGQTLASPRSNAPLRTSHAAVVNPAAAGPVSPVQMVHDSSALFSNVSTRFPQTSPGSYPMVNLQGQSGIRAQPPHLRRTLASLPSTAATPFPRGIPTQDMRTNPPTSSLHPQYQSAPLLPTTASQSGSYGKMPQLGFGAGYGGLPKSSVSALDLLTDVEKRSRENLPVNSVNTPSFNGSVVCLSDDD